MEHPETPSRAAIALLYTYIRHGPGLADASSEEQMKAAGFSDRTRFFKARAELADSGVLTYTRNGKHGRVLLNPTLLLSLISSIVGWLMGGEGSGLGEGLDLSGVLTPDRIEYLIYILVGSSSGSTGRLNGSANQEVLDTNTSEVWETNTSHEEVWETNTSEVVEEVLDINTSPREVWEINTSQASEEVLDINTSLLDRIQAADEMDDTGPETSRKSPYALRRAAQIELIKEAWREVFPQDPYPLTPSNAKNFLAWCENSAQTVYEEIQDIARRKQLDAPVSYVRVTLQRKADEGKMIRRFAPVKHGSTTSTVAGQGVESGTPWDGELQEPSSAWREKQKEALEYAKSLWRDE